MLSSSFSSVPEEQSQWQMQVGAFAASPGDDAHAVGYGYGQLSSISQPGYNGMNGNNNDLYVAQNQMYGHNL
jgi:hypothetical protein